MMSAPAVDQRVHQRHGQRRIGIAGGDERNQRLAALRLAGARRWLVFSTSEERDPRFFGDGVHVLVTATREIDQQDLVFRQGRRELGGIGDGVARFERRDDAFQPAQIVEGRERFVVGDGDVFGGPSP